MLTALADSRSGAMMTMPRDDEPHVICAIGGQRGSAALRRVLPRAKLSTDLRFSAHHVRSC